MNKFNVLKYLSKWKYLIFAVCVLGALIVYKYAMYNQEYTASTVISYTGQNAADGKTPSGDARHNSCLCGYNFVTISVISLSIEISFIFFERSSLK